MLLERLRDRLQDRFPELHITTHGKLLMVSEPPQPRYATFAIATAKYRGDEKFVVEIQGLVGLDEKRTCKGVERAYQVMCEGIEAYQDADEYEIDEEGTPIEGDPLWYHLQIYSLFAPQPGRCKEEDEAMMASRAYLVERGLPADWIPTPMFEVTPAWDEMEG